MMSLQRTFSPSREAERCLETAASTGSSRAHHAAKERYVNPRTNVNINISYIDIQVGRVENQSMLI